MKKALPIVLIFCFALVIAISCSDNKPDKKLEEINAMTQTDPRLALSLLDSIDVSSLNETDRRYYEFLTVKAADKAYIDHTSDSLIKTLLEYYKDKDLYTEVLYYAGRVYSDMGDYPTALEYFQDAIDHSSEETLDDVLLKSHIVSQTGNLIRRLGLSSKAIPYVEEALRLDHIVGDTFNLAYDHELLGNLYLSCGNIDEAEQSYIKANKFAKNLPECDKEFMKMYLAVIKYMRDDTKEAIRILQGIPNKVDSLQLNIVLSYASDIFYEAGIYDSAYYYADQLIHTQIQSDHKYGFQNLFYPEIVHFIPHDSLIPYIERYASTLKKFYAVHDSEAGRLQVAYYNYKIHERERKKAEEKTNRAQSIIFYTLFAVLISIIIVLYLYYKRKYTLIKLRNAINELEVIKQKLHIGNNSNINESINNILEVERTNSLDKLRQYIIEQMEVIKSANNDGQEKTNRFALTKVYTDINDYLKKNLPIPYASPIWEELEQTINIFYPQFKERIFTLYGKKVKSQDYQMIMLIKAGFSPKELGILLAREKSTISYRRKNIAENLFGDKFDNYSVDDIIYHIL